MQIIIVGCGKVGVSLAEVLSKEGHDIIVMDRNPESFKALSEDFNGMTVTGIPIDQDVLKEASIETCDTLVAVTPDDNINIMVCQVAKEFFNVSKVIARINNPVREKIFRNFGIETICPTTLTAAAIISRLDTDAIISTSAIADFSFNFIKIIIEKKDDGKVVKNIAVDKNTHIFGIIRNGIFRYATPESAIKEGDMLVVSELIEE